MNKTTILIAEDEKGISNFIATTLLANGYKALQAYTGQSALSMISSHCPDLVLLDLGLPDMDGMDILKEVRSWTGVPVIVVSARDREQDKVEALDYGADDYLTKPFGTYELLARIRTALRHHLSATSSTNLPKTTYRSGDLCINFDKYLITLNDEEIHLTQIEYKIVALLAQNAGKVMTYESIITQIWGPYALKDNQILRVNMANIRRKIESNPGEPKYIFTEVGVGYRMVEEDN